MCIRDRLERADDQEISVLVEEESRILNYDQILKARTVFDWSKSLSSDGQKNEASVGSSLHSGSRAGQ